VSAPEADRSGIQVISRAAAILRCLESEADGLSLGAIAKRIELPRSTVQRLVDALALEQLLEVRSAGGIRLGPALMRLAAHSHLDITQVARPYLESLAQDTGETAVLVHGSGPALMILHSVVSPQELRVAPSSGNFLTMYATSGGKSLLARMDDDAVTALVADQIKPLTANTLNLQQLLAQLATIRREGFSHDREEHMPGVGAMAIALTTSQGEYAISLVGPAWRIAERESSIKHALQRCQQALGSALHNREG